MAFYDFRFCSLSSLCDPVKMTRRMEDEEFLKYVKICEQGKKTEAAKLEQIKLSFYYLHKYHNRETLDKVWGAVEDMIAENAGLAEFTLDYEGASSEFFFPWLVTIRESPSAALEMAYGYGYDIAHNWRRVPKSDLIDPFVHNDPTFVFNRERQLTVAELVTSERQKFEEESLSIAELKRRVSPKRLFNVADLGAGRMAWARHHKFSFQEWDRIYAYDRDPTIDPDELFPGGAKTKGVFYSKGDIMESLKILPFDVNFNVVILQGVASYYPVDLFREATIRPVYEKLEDGGVFFFDLQLLCPYYRRSVAIFNWPKMRLATSVAEAIETVEDLRLGLRKDGMNFSASYKLDSYNNHPSSIMVTFTKL